MRPLVRRRPRAHHAAWKVVLDPRGAPDGEFMQMVKIYISLVEVPQLPALQPGADHTGAFADVLARGIDDGAGGQGAAGVQAQVQPRGRLVPAA